ncbi:polysaccharide deacetylase family protein [Niallia sp. Krafla_26]|uniref:polysaccharide deacetylase family protein n=1 Tax=Niallia sp. Krafla_26 TaxID=3064703 RepID=UPI003D16A4BC
MFRGKKLNTRGKTALLFLVAIIVILIPGIVVNDGQKAAKVNESTIDPSLELVSFPSEPVTAFADSPLSQSIMEKDREHREAARIEAVDKQNQLDLQENTIYLTFDDGPSKLSNQLLDILDAYGMKATFFMLGPNIKEYPEVVKRKQKEGHGLALHSMTHDVGKLYSSQTAPSEEMKQNQEILKSVTGITSNIVRLPYGSIPYLTEGMRYELDQNGFIVWDWNVDSRDWEFNNHRYVNHTIWAIQKMKQKGETPVVLLHDKPETVKFLPKLLSYLQKQGYQTKVLTSDMPPLTFQCNGRCLPISGLTVGG